MDRASISRRGLLRAGLLAGCSAAAHPWLSTISFAAMPGDNRLVVIVLRGGMDGLDVLRPYGDPDLARLRPSLAADPLAGATDAGGFFALHPALAPLAGLWTAGELAFAPAVATPYRDKRSHFDGQDLLEAGTGADLPIDRQRGGWLNRLTQALPGAGSETAYSIGPEHMLLLSGAADVTSWSPEQRLILSAQGQRLLTEIYHDDPLFRDAAETAWRLGALGNDGSVRGGRGAATLARFAADRLNGAARLAAFSINGWDSHQNQQAVIGRALGQLSEAVLALRDGLGANWSRTLVMALTEFGRTARENGNKGTDHGTGGAMLMAGGALRGGRIIGDWPGLGEGALYQDRDLMPTRDVRAYPGWAMRALFGVEAGLIETSIFPGLDLGGDPGLTA